MYRTPTKGDGDKGDEDITGQDANAGEAQQPRTTPGKQLHNMNKSELIAEIADMLTQTGQEVNLGQLETKRKEDLLREFCRLEAQLAQQGSEGGNPVKTPTSPPNIDNKLIHLLMTQQNKAQERTDAILQQMHEERKEREARQQQQDERLADILAKMGTPGMPSNPTASAQGTGTATTPGTRKLHARKADLPLLGAPEGLSLIDFRAWVTQFRNYEVITKLDEEDLRTRRATIQSALDSAWVKLWSEGMLNVKDGDTTTDVIGALEAYIRRHRDELLDREQFFKRNRRSGESVDCYCTALKELYRNCDYTFTHEVQQVLLRDRLMAGIGNTYMRQEVIKIPRGDRTLDKVLETCRSVESSDATNAKLGGAQGAAQAVRRQSTYKKQKEEKQKEDASRFSRTSTPTTSEKCGYCGHNKHVSRNDCPAKDKECAACGKTGHYQKVCRSKDFNREKKVGAVFADQVHQVDNSQPTQESGNIVTVRLLDKSGKKQLGDIPVVPDTGADDNFMALEHYEKLGCKTADLHPPARTFRTYNGSAVPLLGWTMFTLHAGNKKLRRTFYVTDGSCTTLLSSRTSKDLGIIHFTAPKFPPQTHVHRVHRPSGKKPPAKESTRGKDDTANMDKDTFAKHIIKEFADIFDDERDELPVMEGPPMRIELTANAHPFRVRGPRPIPFHRREAAERTLEDLKKRGIIVPVDTATEWLHPATFVPKKAGSDKLRLTIDLRKLNDFVKRPMHPVRNAEDCVRSVPPTAQFFSTFDAKMGYHQVPVHEDSQDMLTFCTPWGRFKNTRATMGLTSAGDEYNRRTDAALADLPNHAKIVDDVLLYNDTWSAHKEHILNFLRRCRKHGITLNPKKFHIGEPSVPFAGYNVGREGISADPDKVKAIQHFPKPTNVTDLRSFQGLCQQLASFSSRVTESFAPLKPLLKKDSDFIWGPEHERAFDATKEALVAPPVLAQFDPTRPTRLETDASQTRGLGYILTQQDNDGNWRMIEARSRSITDTESRYAPIELEMLGVCWAMQRGRMYLLGLPTFTLIVDHFPLLSILDKQTLDTVDNRRLQRMKAAVNAYQFKTEWVAGKTHRIADALSRAPVDAPDPMKDLDQETHFIHSVNHVTHTYATTLAGDAREDSTTEQLADRTLSELRDKARTDPEYIALLAHLKSGKAKLSPDLTQYKRIADELTVTPEDLIVLHQRLIIPRNARKEVLQRLHAAHQGIERTKQRARQTVYWPGINADITSTVEACTNCQERRPSQQNEPLASDERPTRIFEELAADFFETHGKHFLAVVDRHSLHPFIYPFANAPTAQTTINALKTQFVRTGCPLRLHTDGGLQFTAQATQEFLQQWGVTHRLSTPHYAQSNGLAESAVKSLKTLLIKNGGRMNDSFQEGLLELINTPRTGGKSPAEIVYGQPLRTLVPIHQRAFDKHWLKSIDDHNRCASKKQAQAAEAYNAHARSLPRLDIGDTVRIQDPVSKLWDTVGTIISRGEHRDYRVRLDNGRNYWRNRRFLRLAKHQHDNRLKKNSQTQKKTDTEVPTEGKKKSNEQNASPRRSTRTRRTPNRLQIKN